MKIHIELKSTDIQMIKSGYKNTLVNPWHCILKWNLAFFRGIYFRSSELQRQRRNTIVLFEIEKSENV
ncbi:unnamed protein product [Brugia timori]|uniref:MATH domain-containing protein n=1 Tax=Brugia timori TaxID=42155 RepID=A0A0R3Q7J4_9BILA|nr:unnamed protein product [Brugia timori]